MLTAAKLTEALGVTQGTVKKPMHDGGIKPDEGQQGCNYYGLATLATPRSAVKKA